jgi:predicted ABC-type ATPase
MNKGNNRQPTLHIIAGANGAGKTTFALEYLPRYGGCRNFINADLIARGLSPFDPDISALAAGRLFLQQIRVQLAGYNTFAFETTLAGQSHVNLIKRIKKCGYRIALFFLWIPTVELAEKRIAERVMTGGHSIPTKTVRRRFKRGLINLFKLYMPMADYCAIFDNSSINPVLVYEKSGSDERIPQPDIFENIQAQAARSGS